MDFSEGFVDQEIWTRVGYHFENISRYSREPAAAELS